MARKPRGGDAPVRLSEYMAPPPRHPEIAALLDALIRIELAAEWIIRSHDWLRDAYAKTALDGVPARFPQGFDYHDLPPEVGEDERGAALVARLDGIDDHPCGATVRAWSHRRDQLVWSIRDWRNAVHRARTLLPTVSGRMDDKRGPERTWWTTTVRGFLNEMGGLLPATSWDKPPRIDDATTIRLLGERLPQLVQFMADLKTLGPPPAPKDAPHEINAVINGSPRPPSRLAAATGNRAGALPRNSIMAARNDAEAAVWEIADTVHELAQGPRLAHWRQRVVEYLAAVSAYRHKNFKHKHAGLIHDAAGELILAVKVKTPGPTDPHEAGDTWLALDYALLAALHDLRHGNDPRSGARPIVTVENFAGGLRPNHSPTRSKSEKESMFDWYRRHDCWFGGAKNDEPKRAPGGLGMLAYVRHLAHTEPARLAARLRAALVRVRAELATVDGVVDKAPATPNAGRIPNAARNSPGATPTRGESNALERVRDGLFGAIRRAVDLAESVERLEAEYAHAKQPNAGYFYVPSTELAGRGLDPEWQDRVPTRERGPRRAAIDDVLALRAAVDEAIDAVGRVKWLDSAMGPGWVVRTVGQLRKLRGAIVRGHGGDPFPSALPMIRAGVPEALRKHARDVGERMEEVKSAILAGIWEVASAGEVGARPGVQRSYSTVKPKPLPTEINGVINGDSEATTLPAPKAISKGDDGHNSAPSGPTMRDLATDAGISDDTFRRVRIAAGIEVKLKGAAARNRRYTPGEIARLIAAAKGGNYIERAAMAQKWAKSIGK